MANIKYNDCPFGQHCIRAEVIINQTDDLYDTLFNAMSKFQGFIHILINKEHYVINQQTTQVIPCDSYDKAQDWTYKFSAQHLMI